MLVLRLDRDCLMLRLGPVIGICPVASQDEKKRGHIPMLAFLLVDDWNLYPSWTASNSSVPGNGAACLEMSARLQITDRTSGLET